PYDVEQPRQHDGLVRLRYGRVNEHRPCQSNRLDGVHCFLGLGWRVEAEVQLELPLKGLLIVIIQVGRDGDVVPGGMVVSRAVVTPETTRDVWPDGRLLQ